MREKKSTGSHGDHRSKRLTDEQALSAVRDILLAGNRMGIGEQRRLSLADKFILKRLETEGPWRLLAEMIEHEKAKSEVLEFELGSAFENFSSANDCGRTAFIRSVEALQHYAVQASGSIGGPRLERGQLAAIAYGLEAISDLNAGIKNPFCNRRPLEGNARPPSTALAHFHGEVAAFIEILLLTRARARVTKTWACAQVYKLAKKKAERLEVDFHKTTPESWHERIANFDWKNLLEKRVYELSALKGYKIERERFLYILRSARGAQRRGDNLETYCKALAADAFGAALVPRRAD